MRIAKDDFPFLLLILFAALVFWCSSEGPDYSRYRDWGEAFQLGSATSIESETVSPSGMPVSHWGHGTGVVLGIFSLLFPAFFDPALSGRCAGVAMFLMTSIALCGVMNASGLERRLKLFVFSLFLAGTNFGVYFIYLASEAVTSAIVMLLSWMVLAGNRNTLVSAAALGAGSSLLMTCRLQAVLALVPLFGVFVWREARSSDISRSLLFLAVAGLGLFVGVLQVMQINQWMTGHWLQSPLYFGDGTFQSLGEPRFAGRVLLSDWVGLLVRTPLEVVAFFAALGLSFRKSVPAEWRLFFGLACLVNLANFAIVSGYYAWHGSGGFGSRYFIPSALLVFLALPIALKDAHGRRYASRLPIILSLLAVPPVISLAGIKGALVVGAMALAAWAAVRNRHGPACSRVMSAMTAISTVILSAFLYFAVSQQITISGVLDSVSIRARMWGLTPVLILLVALSVNTYVSAEDRRSSFDSARVHLGIGIAGVALVLFQAVLFADFRSATEAYRAAQIISPDARFRYRARFNFENFSDDVDAAVTAFEYTDRELTPLRMFRDATRENAAMRNR